MLFLSFKSGKILWPDALPDTNSVWCIFCWDTISGWFMRKTSKLFILYLKTCYKPIQGIKSKNHWAMAFDMQTSLFSMLWIIKLFLSDLWSNINFFQYLIKTFQVNLLFTLESALVNQIWFLVFRCHSVPRSFHLNQFTSIQ